MKCTNPPVTKRFLSKKSMLRKKIVILNSAFSATSRWLFTLDVYSLKLSELGNYNGILMTLGLTVMRCKSNLKFKLLYLAPTNINIKVFFTMEDTGRSI